MPLKSVRIHNAALNLENIVVYLLLSLKGLQLYKGFRLIAQHYRYRLSVHTFLISPAKTMLCFQISKQILTMKPFQ